MEQTKNVSTIEELEQEIKNVRSAQLQYAKYSQEQVDKIFRAVALKANNLRIIL